MSGKAVQVCGAAVIVDVHAVRLAVDKIDIAVESPEQLRRRGGGCAVGAVHQHAKSRKVAFDRAGEMVDVRFLRLRESVAQYADLIMRRDGDRLVTEELFLDFRLCLIRQLVALFVEDLDAVVLIGIVRRGDNDACVRTFQNRQIGNRRRRQHAERHHIAADGANTCNKRAFEHIRRDACILAYGNERFSALFFL